MNGKIKWFYIVLCALVLVFFVATAFAQEPIIYPAKGQSQEQMEKDKYDCYNWAKKQSGFDPMQGKQAPPPQAQGPTGERARGAAAGAAIGAAAGDAGKGAAAGAVAGGIKKRQQKRQQAKAQEQQAASADAARTQYNKAYGACLEGRGYTVK